MRQAIAFITALCLSSVLITHLSSEVFQKQINVVEMKR